jgi:peptidoglycan/LPS O-acetylase OafA/YrhL
MTTPSSVWPYFVISALFLLFSWLICATTERFSKSILIKDGGRHESIDGIRGFLALGVFFHHALVNFSYQTTNVWEAPDEPFYVMTGQLGVGFFFMITAFLFWGRVLMSSSRIDWIDLYRSRVRRIVPMYVLSVALLVIIAFANTGIGEGLRFGAVLKAVLKWFCFSFVGSPDINGFKDTFTINAGVFWTLAYEWKFYFVLPFMMALLLTAGRWLVYVLIFLYATLADEKFLYYFLCGMLVADIYFCRKIKLNISPWRCDLWFILILCGVMVAFSTAYGLLQSLLSGTAFFMMLNGQGVFGLLHTKAAKLLGQVSYSIYLLHGVVITVALAVFRWAGIKWVDSNYWEAVLVMGLILITTSVLTFRFVEFPFLTKSPTKAGGKSELDETIHLSDRRILGK